MSIWKNHGGVLNGSNDICQWKIQKTRIFQNAIFLLFHLKILPYFMLYFCNRIEFHILSTSVKSIFVILLIIPCNEWFKMHHEWLNLIKIDCFWFSRLPFILYSAIFSQFWSFATQTFVWLPHFIFLGESCCLDNDLQYYHL